MSSGDAGLPALAPIPPSPEDLRASEALPVITAAWPAPAHIRAVSTTRGGGTSDAPHASLNLGHNTADDPGAVQHNRARVRAALNLPGEPLWLNQVHGDAVLTAKDHAAARAASSVVPTADACAAPIAGPGASPVCAILTADCLPVLFCDRAGTWIAAAHAGWRGLAAGILPHTCEAMAVPPEEILAWMGPGIGAAAYEVGPEVRETFVTADPGNESYFEARETAPEGFKQTRYLADLYGIARRQLLAAGVGAVYGGEHCTLTEAERFFSFRRDGETGRMASLIWSSG